VKLSVTESVIKLSLFAAINDVVISSGLDSVHLFFIADTIYVILC
jgi:hypothetical protein